MSRDLTDDVTLVTPVSHACSSSSLDVTRYEHVRAKAIKRSRVVRCDDSRLPDGLWTKFTKVHNEHVTDGDEVDRRDANDFVRLRTRVPLRAKNRNETRCKENLQTTTGVLVKIGGKLVVLPSVERATR